MKEKIPDLLEMIQDIPFNILEIAVFFLLLLLVIVGWRKGLIKKVSALLSVVLSILLVSLFLPQISGFLKEKTPLYEAIEEQCRTQMEKQMDRAAPALDLLHLDEEQQAEVIRHLQLPLIVQNRLLRFNNREGYLACEASTFPDYIVRYISGIILNILAFVSSLLLVNILLALLFHILNLFASIPGISLVNRILGASLGLLEGLFLLWAAFLILSVFSGTEAGAWFMEQVRTSRFLKMMYESNLFMRIVLLQGFR